MSSPPLQLVHDMTTQKLRQQWEFAQARIAVATKTKAGGEGGCPCARAVLVSSVAGRRMCVRSLSTLVAQLCHACTSCTLLLHPASPRVSPTCLLYSCICSLATAAAEKDVATALTTYRGAVTTAMLPRGDEKHRIAAEECYVIQYVVNPGGVAGQGDDILYGLDGSTDRASSSSAVAASAAQAAPHHQTASLTIRYCGKPVIRPVPGHAAQVKGFQYASSLPAYLSRSIGTGKIILGDEPAAIEDESASPAAQESDEMVIGKDGLPLPPQRQTPLDLA